jgi:hypothetical protein
MPLFLVDPSLGISLEIDVPEETEHALRLQWERTADADRRRSFCRRLELQLESLIPELLDWDIKAPTPAQLSFATSISRKLGVPLPVAAIRFRGEMTNFLEEHAPLMRVKKTPTRPARKADSDPDLDIPF